MKFNTESNFFKFLGTFGRFVYLNVVFVITCIPIITIGTSVTALYSTMFKYINEEDNSFVPNFLKAFKSTFKISTIYYLLSLIFAGIIIFNIQFWYKLNNGWSMIVLGLVILLFIAFLLTLIYLFPLLARYTQTGRQVIQNAFLLSIANFIITLAIIAITIASLALTYFTASFRAIFAIFGIAFIVYCKSLLLMKAFQKYDK